METPLLDRIDSPADLKKLAEAELPQLAAELRGKVLEVTGRCGGHLASNLGAVELTIALHRVFDAAAEPFFFDVGHQAYIHKLLTGRRREFDTLRQYGGISGFPLPAESPFDPAVAGHSGSALSLALGVAAARAAAGDPRKVIAVVGDASLANGVSLEALNSAMYCGKNLVIILNDNQMSISRNVGAFSRALSKLIAGRLYNRLRGGVKRVAARRRRLLRLLRHFNDLLKKALMPPATVFEGLGIRYFGPVDGHSLGELVPLLDRIRELDGPVLLHVVTRKGSGCPFAEADPARYHGVPPFDPATGAFLSTGRRGESFSEAFGDAVLRLAQEHPEVVAVTPAMADGTGLSEFRRRFPKRFYDVGICEEHAVGFAAGLALNGSRPFCAGYASFMHRALDGIFHDIALNRLPVVLGFDRAGAVEDGPTHHGIYDAAFLRQLPGVTVMMPRDAEELRAMIGFAYRLGAPVVLRYPRGSGAEDPELPPVAPLEAGCAQILAPGDPGAPAIWAAGREVDTAFAVARRWRERRGVSPAVINVRFLAPFDTATAARFAGVPAVAIEDSSVTGGVASALAESRAAAGGSAPMLAFGWSSDRFPPHGAVGELRRAAGFTPEAIVAEMERRILR